MLAFPISIVVENFNDEYHGPSNGDPATIATPSGTQKKSVNGSVTNQPETCVVSEVGQALPAEKRALRSFGRFGAPVRKQATMTAQKS